MSVKQLVGEDALVGWRVAALLGAIMFGAGATWATGIGQNITEKEKDEILHSLKIGADADRQHDIEIMEMRTLLTAINQSVINVSGKVDRLIERAHP